MYEPFAITVIRNDLRNKTITIETTSDIDPDSVNDKNVVIMERKSKKIMEYRFEVKRKSLILTLLDWPIPKMEYVIKVSDLLNAIGDQLQQGVRKTIVFESSLCSIMHIVYPSFGEVISDLKIILNEEVPEGGNGVTFEPINSYYIEIASDCNFHNIVKDILIKDRLMVLLPDIADGQYYVRARVQQEEEYGLWSDTVSFLLQDKASVSQPDGEDPVYIEDIEILSGIEHGILGDSFLFEMNCELDQDSVDNIIVIRRDY